MITEMLFNHTIELNKDYVVECRCCGVRSTLKKAHIERWGWRRRLEGLSPLGKFLCRECKEKHDDI